jgi:hypothetical protein
MIPKDKKAQQFAILACEPFTYIPNNGSQFPYLGELHENDTIEDILKRLCNTKFNDGFQQGLIQKQEEIKRVLGINEED